MGFPSGAVIKNLPADAGDARDEGLIPESGRSPGEEIATRSSILAWKIPWVEDPGRLQPTGSQSRTWLSMHKYANKYTDMKIKHTTLYIIASLKIKYLGYKSTKCAQNLGWKLYKTEQNKQEDVSKCKDTEYS